MHYKVYVKASDDRDGYKVDYCLAKFTRMLLIDVAIRAEQLIQSWAPLFKFIYIEIEKVND